jgi:hypothetical protein
MDNSVLIGAAAAIAVGDLTLGSEAMAPRSGEG